LNTCFLFISNVAPVSYLNKNMTNKGKWTQDKHRAFIKEWEKYGNNWIDIGKVVSTRTPVQKRSTLNVTLNKI
jgi:hypothetical protein